MPGKPRTIDEYLKPLTKEIRASLEKLRKAIQMAKLSRRSSLRIEK